MGIGKSMRNFIKVFSKDTFRRMERVRESKFLPREPLNAAQTSFSHIRIAIESTFPFRLRLLLLNRRLEGIFSHNLHSLPSSFFLFPGMWEYLRRAGKGEKQKKNIRTKTETTWHGKSWRGIGNGTFMRSNKNPPRFKTPVIKKGKRIFCFPPPPLSRLRKGKKTCEIARERKRRRRRSSPRFPPFDSIDLGFPIRFGFRQEKLIY